MRTPEYISWMSARQRCNNPKATGFQRYGGRGVRMCPRWDSFACFLEDMGQRPTGTSLDRFPNPDGDYGPGNCRWATAKEQAQSIKHVPRHRLIGPRLKDKHFRSQAARKGKTMCPSPTCQAGPAGLFAISHSASLWSELTHDQAA